MNFQNFLNKIKIQGQIRWGICLVLIFVFDINPANSVTVEKNIKDFRTSFCSTEKNICINIFAEEATPSTLKSIFFLKKVTATTQKSNHPNIGNKTIETKTYSMAYLDLTNQQLTFIEKEGNHVQEIVYELKDLTSKVYR